MEESLISVVTATRTGKHLLDCVRAVAAQTYPSVEHLVLVDKNEQLVEQLAEWKRVNPSIRCALIMDIPDDMFANERVGALYNRGFELASGAYIARIDDDNTVTPEHIEALYRTLEVGGYDACYSWRKLFLRSGKPYLQEALPWHAFNDPTRAKLLYRVWREAGITTPGSNIFKDQLHAEWKGSVFSTVDASEWLWSRRVLEHVRFTTDMSYWELLYGYSDDDLFAMHFIEAGFRAGCSEQPTLSYFLGGHSNDMPEGYKNLSADAI